MVLFLSLYNKRGDNVINNLILFSDDQCFSALNQAFLLITYSEEKIVNTSKNSSLQNNATFDENLQMFVLYYACLFKASPINVA